MSIGVILGLFSSLPVAAITWSSVEYLLFQQIHVHRGLYSLVYYSLISRSTTCLLSEYQNHFDVFYALRLIGNTNNGVLIPPT